MDTGPFGIRSAARNIAQVIGADWLGAVSDPPFQDPQDRKGLLLLERRPWILRVILRDRPKLQQLEQMRCYHKAASLAGGIFRRD